MALIELVEKRHLALLPRGADILRRLEVGDRLGAPIEPRALIGRRHEARAPVPRATRHHGAGIVEHDHKARQICVLGPQAVAHPTSQRRPARQRRAGIHLADAAHMIQPVGPARADHGQVVDACGDVGKPVRNPDSALAVLLPFPLRRQERSPAFSHGRDHRLEARTATAGRQDGRAPVSDRTCRDDSGRPSMNRKITLLAVAGRHHAGRDAPDSSRRSRATPESDALALPSISPSAAAPKPMPASSSHSRRESGSTR